MPFEHNEKKPGDLIRSADWNAVGTEVVRLGIDKISRVGTESLEGPLTIRGALTVGPPGDGPALSVRGDLAVGQASAGASVRILKKQEDGKDATHGALVLGTDAPSSAALRVGYSSTYSWLQGQGQQAIALNPHGGNVGIGIVPGTSARLHVGGDALVTGNLSFGNGALLRADQGGSLELGGNNDTAGTGTPYIDFHFKDKKEDYNVRLMNDADKRLSLVGGDLRLDSGREIVFADNGQIRSLDNNHRILFRRSEDKLELREIGSIIFSPGASAGAETAKAILTSAGQLAIGTPTPQRLLHVEGQEIHSGGTNGGFSFSNRESAWTDAGNNGERWVLYSTGKVARLWSGGDRLSVGADGTLTLTGRLVSKSGRVAAGGRGKIDITSTVWTDMPDMKLSITTTGNPVLVLFKTGGVQTTGANQLRGQWRMFAGGTEVAYTRHEFHNAGWELRDVSMSALASLPAGTHEIKVQWAAEGGTLSACWYNDNRTLIAVEM